MFKFLRIIRTVVFLKPIQLWYLVYYRFRGRLKYENYSKNVSIIDIVNVESLYKRRIGSDRNKFFFNDSEVRFTFLNKGHSFPIQQINWNYCSFGKLWTYNLNYFEYLDECSVDQAEQLISSYIQNAQSLKDGLESYPTSLRIFNWIYFSISNRFAPAYLIKFIRSDFERLSRNKEYHIQANHLLENAIALFLGSIYFLDRPNRKNSRNLLLKELREQFDESGLHYEGSFMYHSILINRLLDLYWIVTLHATEELDIKKILFETISKGLRVLKEYSVNDTLPMFNDANEVETIPTSYLLDKGNAYGILCASNLSGNVAYKKIATECFWVVADYAEIVPKYQPGHAHADTFSFILYFKKQPIIVDPGCSTYEKNMDRQFERSTISHNTISCANDNSSEVWGGFRVGRRAKIFNLKESNYSIVAEHNGYKKYRITHKRELRLTEMSLIVIDSLVKNVSKSAISSIHFHPDVRVKCFENFILINDQLRFDWEGIESWGVEPYSYAYGFNDHIAGKVWRAKVTNYSVLKFSKIIYEN